MSLPPPTQDSGIFNSSFFINPNNPLTLDYCDTRYIRYGGSATLSGLTVSGNVDASSLSIGGSPVSLSSISGISAGTAAASKALVLGASSDISDIATIRLTSNQVAALSSTADSYPLCIRRNTATNGDAASIAFLTTTLTPQSSTPCGTISFVRTGTNGIGDFRVAIRPDTTTTSAMAERLRILPDGTTLFNGQSQYVRSSWGQPLNSMGPIHCYANSSYYGYGNTAWNTVQSWTGYGSAGYTCNLIVSNGNSEAFPWRFGSTTSGGLALQVDSNLALTINSSRYVCIGSSSASYPFEITMGGVGVSASNYGVVQNTGASYSQIGPSPTYYIALRCADGIRTNCVLLSSDRRLKTNFRDITDDMVENFMNMCKPCIYDLKRNGQTQMGWIAQDIAKAGFHGLLSLDEPRENFPAESDDDIPDRLMTVTYERIPAILQLELLKQRARIKELEEKFEALMRNSSSH